MKIGNNFFFTYGTVFNIKQLNEIEKYKIYSRFN